MDFILNCTLTLDRTTLNDNVVSDIVWYNQTSQPIVMETNNNVALLHFNELMPSQEGDYTCQANLNDTSGAVTVINQTYQISVQSKITLEIVMKLSFSILAPPPIYFYTIQPSILGESLSIHCHTNVNFFSRSYSIVTVSIDTNGRSIANVTRHGESFLFYTFFSIDSLRVSDTGEYQCIVTVTQYDINYQFNRTLLLSLTSMFSHIDYVYYNSFV